VLADPDQEMNSKTLFTVPLQNKAEMFLQ